MEQETKVGIRVGFEWATGGGCVITLVAGYGVLLPASIVVLVICGGTAFTCAVFEHGWHRASTRTRSIMKVVVIVLCIWVAMGFIGYKIWPRSLKPVTIVWNPPAPISAETPLSPDQLNATALSEGKPVEGVFVYNPALGATLPSGRDTLSVTFTPADEKFRQHSMTQTILVYSVASPSPGLPGYLRKQNADNVARAEIRMHIFALEDDGNKVIKDLSNGTPNAQSELRRWRATIDQYLTKTFNKHAADIFDNSLYGNTDMPMPPHTDVQAVQRQQDGLRGIMESLAPPVQYVGFATDPKLKGDMLALALDLQQYFSEHRGCPSNAVQQCLTEERATESAEYLPRLRSILDRMEKVGFSDEVLEDTIKNFPTGGIGFNTPYHLREDADKIQ